MKQSFTEKVILGIVFVIFTAYAISLVFPFAWALINSFKTSVEFFNIDNVWKIPSKWMVSNYVNVLSEYEIGKMFLRSIYVTVAGTGLAVMMSATTAYVVSKYEFKLRNLIYITAVTVMVIPTVGSLSATFKLVNNLGLYNNLWLFPIIYAGGFGFGFLLLYAYFKGISWTYAEAAFVDGATDFDVFFKIMIPQAKPALVALGIIQGINVWNDFFAPFMFIPEKKTLAVGLQDLVNIMQYRAEWPKMFAAMIISALPIIIVFVIFQKTIMENTVAGGLKG
ncbi:ABC-type carbohydrate transport system, permease component [Paracholeplasma brassicae]|uniref:ABC-type carbohydrate transport system, permease component n=1 Tax=Acholeplasma brassicae TaxID=61635 RepID=U4KSK9_9MOLU|nr:carbohydrate ABC transporter permease [Paracholeplasma brassicae]CCV65119.1 ABC-type carbohydrate transport system, permease component [Paracholeplasma brassicae]